MFPTNKFGTSKEKDLEQVEIDPEKEDKTWDEEVFIAAKMVVQDYKMKYKDSWKKMFRAKAPKLFQEHPYCIQQLNRYHIY